VPLEELLEVVEKFNEGSWVAVVTVQGGGGGQLVGHVTQVNVVVHQSTYATVREALHRPWEEKEFLVAGLIEDLVPEVGDEALDLAVRPASCPEGGADGSFAQVHLHEQDSVLVSERMVARPVLVPRGEVIGFGWGRGIRFG
jgi:hypothetical protein